MSLPKNDFSRLTRANAEWIASPKLMLIGGQWVNALSGMSMPVYDPSSRQSFCSVPRASLADVDRAVQSARKAFDGGAWPRMPATERSKLLWRLAELMEKDSRNIAQLESIDNGKPVSRAQEIDVPLAVNFVRYMAGMATKIHGRTFEMAVPYAPGFDFAAQTLREPVGVVGAIIPWNMPLLMAVWKICPAVAAGCTIILKPASDTPLVALRIGELAMEAGFPDGVINIICGPGGEIGDALVTHPGVDKIAFTGSTAIGKAIARRAVDGMKRISLELGGKSPVIVMPDAALEVAVPGIMLGIFANCGQVCSAGSRLYVHKSLHDSLVSALVEATNTIEVGPGLEPDTLMGPMVSEGQLLTVKSYIKLGLSEGADLLAGGHAPDSEGYFIEPTILGNTNNQMRVVREEIFGPVLTVQTFETEDEAIELANDSIYGLASSIYSTDAEAIDRLIPRIRAGTVWTNCHNIFDAALPFGGCKDSGVGREMGPEVIEMYTELKSVCRARRKIT